MPSAGDRTPRYLGAAWYFLFLESRSIPRWLSLFGLAAVTLGLAGAAFDLVGYDVGMFGYFGILPFEVVVGLWLLAAYSARRSMETAVVVLEPAR